VLPLPLLVATVQPTQIQRRRAARAHYCPRVVTPEASSPSRLWCFAYAGMCSSPPARVPRPAARLRMSCASGCGGAGNRRGPTRCAGFSSSLELADLFLYFVQFLDCISFFYSILYSRLVPSTPPTSSTPRPIHTPLDSLTSTLQLDRLRANRAEETLDESAVSPHSAAWCIRASVRIVGPVRRAGENAHHGTSLRTTTTAPPATGARARLPDPRVGP
jgi:hypothetical protein